MFKRSSNPLGKVACEPKKTYPSEETGTNASSNLEPRTKTPINAETTTNTKLSDATTTNSKLSDAASATTNINLSDASTITNTKSSDASKTTNPRSSDGSKGTNAKSSDATSTNLKTSDASKPTNLKLSDASGTINPKLSDGVLSTNSELSDTSKTTNTKSCDAKITDSYSSISRGGTSSIRSNSIDSALSGPLKPHTGGDGRWDAIQLANSRDSPLRLSHFRLLKRLGYGDIGSVYLVELRGTDSFFAMKVMDKASLASRNKILRAQTEREILALLDHPFLPTLYSYFETDKFYCLVMEYCSGGNLHSLRQRQPNGYFTEQAARFYASEVLLALEYLHMLGVIYRDLKPENVLVRDGGHIMLSDFDLSLRCSVSPTLVKSSSAHGGLNGGHGILDNDFAVTGCIQPSAFFPRILPKKNRKSKSDFSVASGALELMAEPTNARSMSFVGTHEYLAPEIICGEGHGSAVDWWTFGIFLYELLHGMTPFKGAGNRATLYNVVGQPLRFPDAPSVSTVARDLIRGLLVKDPQKRIAYKRGATEIKQHPFFEGVNWALVRSTAPPHVPEPVDFTQFASKDGGPMDKKGGESAGGGKKLGSSDSSHLDFEYF